MKSVAKFVITSNISFEAVVPRLEDKLNYYYKPDHEVDLFDEITLLFRYRNRETIIIMKDTVDSVLSDIKRLQKINELPNNINPGELGGYYNQYSYAEDFDSVNFEDYWLWSGTENQVWVYSKNGQIYLEVSPTSAYLFSERSLDALKSFKNFMQNYKPIFFGSISEKILKNWIEKSSSILKLARDHHIKSHL